MLGRWVITYAWYYIQVMTTAGRYKKQLLKVHKISVLQFHNYI